jgi:NAD(P)H-dependent FMN reductase
MPDDAAAPKILAFSGSLRQESFNQKLVTIAARGAERAGAEVTLIALRDLPMPLFSEDLEAESGMDPNGRRFKELMIAADGVLLSSPEYNGSLSGALKNAIDWASRPEEGEQPLVAFKNKHVQLLSASPGGLGGIRGLIHLHALLGGIQMHVMPQQFCVSKAHEEFDDAGDLKDESKRSQVEALGEKLVEVCRATKG